ncbi:unnamed protein product [Lactuca saligna]|uniref:Fatty acyl-CoA reductase n=1 Tax=Lactuca saligna TaxID=75948 RepID=A0AA35V1I3_LACSI|nr:unnamed protein product [Lactuca saligna]
MSNTAYVSGKKSGIILETPCYLGEILDIKHEKRIIDDRLKELEYHNANEEAVKMAMKDLGTQRVSHCGWPNTYVFTKALGEMVLQQFKGDIPLVIFRPTIISSTYKEPFPGGSKVLGPSIALLLAMEKAGTKVVNVILCQAFAGTCKNIERKINLVLRLVKLYQPYLFSTSLYDDINTEKLRNMVRESKHDDVAFYFDPKIIDWEDYFLHTHIPGVVRYEFK